MLPSISVVGSTGLIGHQFLKSLSASDFGQVTAITRRAIPGLENQSLIRQVIHDFEDIQGLKEALHTELLVCALGTTIKTAGSQQRFFEIDHDLPLELARLALQEGCRRLVLVSAVGADPASRIFYSRVKGQLEVDLSALEFEQLHILRPSMLLGERPEKRPGEALGKVFMQPFKGIIPWKYRPIHAKTMAATILALTRTNEPGIHIHEGRALFHPN